VSFEVGGAASERAVPDTGETGDADGGVQVATGQEDPGED
jgi:hypothetical protein